MENFFITLGTTKEMVCGKTQQFLSFINLSLSITAFSSSYFSKSMFLTAYNKGEISYPRINTHNMSFL